MATTYNNLAVLAVYTYYISKARDLKKITLALKEIKELHTRKNITSIIYGITEN
jgi:hypothetical protein